jgi:hypothetical protein
MANYLRHRLEFGERECLDIMTDEESWIFWLNSHIAQLFPEGSPKSKTRGLAVGVKSDNLCFFLIARAIDYFIIWRQ